MPSHTIGVFDSGFGGLTVLRALLPLIPDAQYIYLGDTARLPYGAKSRETVSRYAVESALFLERRGADMLVIACNTATALALDDIRNAVDVPVVGVIEPGARAALAAVRAQHDALHASEVLVLATAATVQSHAYRDTCAALGLHATEKACPLLVPLVEEGWIDHHVTREVLRIYLAEALGECSPEAVLLGCTHYPLIAAQIGETLRACGSSAVVIDSAHVTARAVAEHLSQSTGHSTAVQKIETEVSFHCYTTDSTEKFQRLGSLFLGKPIRTVEHLDLDTWSCK